MTRSCNCRLGCQLGYGYLHRIPSGELPSSGKLSPSKPLAPVSVEDGFSEVKAILKIPFNEYDKIKWLCFSLPCGYVHMCVVVVAIVVILFYDSKTFMYPTIYKRLCK